MNSLNMDTQSYSTEFWRWYFKNYYSDFEYLKEDQTLIEDVENPLSDEGTFDWMIDLEEGVCRHNEETYPIALYIAHQRDIEPKQVKRELARSNQVWQSEDQQDVFVTPFFRDEEAFQWKMQKGDNVVVVTTFDVVLNSIIEKYNFDRQEWERTYQGELRGLKSRNLVKRPFQFEPSQTHSRKRFSEAVWEKDFFQVKNMKNEDVRRFWTYLNEYYNPRIIREYDHYGFIEFEGESFFLAGNVLVRFPNENEELQLIGKSDGAFKVDDNKFVRPPDDAVYLPHFDLGIPDPESAQYENAMKALYNDAMFETRLSDVEEHFCAMIGGDDDFRRWGQLVIGYVFSFLFFDEIYDLYQHVVFLYLYGEGNVGKGELANRILDFFGINYLDSLNTPPARSVDEGLEQKSKIPLWIDEHVPEVPGKKSKIEDQTWNSWFELKPRPTNIQRDNKWGKERKKVRTMPLFCSNFKPRTDHLLSRCLILEYRKSVRGPEHHVRWLKQHKKSLQLLMLSAMQYYSRFNREVFSWNLDLLRTILRDEIKEELESRMDDVVLQDRQITQFAILFTVYHWLKASYRRKVEEIYAKKRNLQDGDDVPYKNEQMEVVKFEILDLTDAELFDFVKDQVIESAVSAARYNPLTEYIETIGTLIQNGKITQKHFNWMKDGTLKIWAKGVWDAYESEKKGTDSMVRREVVENKLKALSEVNQKGNLKVVTWTIIEGLEKSKIHQRGFYISDAYDKELLRRAFNWEKYKPSGAPSYEDINNETSKEEEVPF